MTIKFISRGTSHVNNTVLVQVVHVGFDTRAELENGLISVLMPDADIPLKVTWEPTHETCPAIIRKAFGFPFTPLLDPVTPAFYRKAMGIKLAEQLGNQIKGEVSC